MTLKEQIHADTTSALKAGDRTRVSVLRMLRAKVLEKEVELRRQKGRDYQLNDQEVIEVTAAYAKQRRQSIESYQQAGREDLVLKEETELEILQQYLPRQLSADEIEALVDAAIAESGATDLKQMGNVMKVLMPRVKGAADGKTVNAIVKQKLSSET
jgi:uncharacterized protein YqeY